MQYPSHVQHRPCSHALQLRACHSSSPSDSCYCRTPSPSPLCTAVRARIASHPPPRDAALTYYRDGCHGANPRRHQGDDARTHTNVVLLPRYSPRRTRAACRISDHHHHHHHHDHHHRHLLRLGASGCRFCAVWYCFSFRSPWVSCPPCADRLKDQCHVMNITHATDSVQRQILSLLSIFCRDNDGAFNPFYAWRRYHSCWERDGTTNRQVPIRTTIVAGSVCHVMW